MPAKECPLLVLLHCRCEIAPLQSAGVKACAHRSLVGRNCSFSVRKPAVQGLRGFRVLRVYASQFQIVCPRVSGDKSPHGREIFELLCVKQLFNSSYGYGAACSAIRSRSSQSIHGGATMLPTLQSCFIREVPFRFYFAICQLDGIRCLWEPPRGTRESLAIVARQARQGNNFSSPAPGGCLPDAGLPHDAPDWKPTLSARAVPVWHRARGQWKIWSDSVVATVETQQVDQAAQLGLSFAEPSRLADEIEQFSKEGQLDKALDILKVMDLQSNFPSVSMYRTLLRACTKRKALAHAKSVCAHLSQHGLESTLGEYVVSTLVKSGGLQDALEVFDRLPRRTASSWKALISGYAMSGQGQKALITYRCMLEERLDPDKQTFISVLKACGSMLSLEEGKRIHAEVLQYGWEADLFVGTCLVDMYSKCGSIDDAQNVFDGLSQHDVVLWTALLAAYAQRAQAEKVLLLYEQMLLEGVSPNSRTFVNLLQACGMVAAEEVEVVLDGLYVKPKSLQMGKAMHAEALRRNCHTDVFVGNTLLDTYVRCGRLVDAWTLFGELPQRDVVSWNVMLLACVGQGEAEKVVDLYVQMQEEGVSPDAWTLVSALQACGMLAMEEVGVIVCGQCIKVNSLGKGRGIHADACRKSHDSEASVGKALVSMYGKCCSIGDAECVFQGFSYTNVVSCSAMLVTYIQHEQAEKALRLYESMLMESVSPDVRTCGSALQACGMLAEKEEGDRVIGRSTKVKFLNKVKAIHAQACRKGYDVDVCIVKLLITTYVKCGGIEDAQVAFESLPDQDVVAWNAMLAAYLQLGETEKALQLYQQMLEKDTSSDVWTFVSMLRACGMRAERKDPLGDTQATKLESLGRGKAIYADAWRKGYDSNIFISNTLVSMYSKCGSVLDAWNVFNGSSKGHVVSWNAMLSAYVEHGQAGKALQVYEQMHITSVSPDFLTFISMFQTCAVLAEKEEEGFVSGQSTKVKSLEYGKALHAYAWGKGYDLDVLVGNSLIAMYGKCRSIVHAEIVFQRLSERDIVSWNSMLTAYVQLGQAEKALQVYGQMQEECSTPDVRTFVSALGACGMLAEEEAGVITGQECIKVNSLQKGKAVHANAHKKGFVSDVFVDSILVTMYGKCGSILDAKNVFNVSTKRNVVLWNAMVSVYVLHEQREMALQLYRQMQQEGISPNEITLNCILQMCVGTHGLEMCKQIHQCHILADGVLSPMLATTLVHAYGRCGNMVDAQGLFDTQPLHNVVLWNALMAGYSRQGECALSLKCYDEMRLAGVKPNKVTFLSILSACSHGGLVYEGLEYFESMSREHGIIPDIQHFGCMVDLLGRAGYFTELETLVSTMPMEPDLAMLLCLLGSCQKHGMVAMGRRMFDCAVRLQPQHAAAYVLMVNIYADAGLWNRAKEVNELRHKAGAWKEPGQSWIEHEGTEHAFGVRDGYGTPPEQLYKLLTRLQK